MEGAWVIFIIVVLIVAAVFFKSHKKKNAPRGRESSKDWSINWSTGFPKTPTMRGVGWKIDFPTGPQAHLHYVQWYKPPALREGMSLTAMIEVVGGPFTAIEFPQNPAMITLMVQRKGDKMTEGFINYRWFSDETIPMTPGQHTMTWVLSVENFGDVYGGRDVESFRKALAEAESVGILFGSAGGRGHGVYAQAPGSVELKYLD